MIRRLLIANRGEIAVRIARTAIDLGMESVAVYATDDADALHVARADRAVPLAGAGVAAYLDIGDLLRVATEVGADAIHPGYGFLSERADLARACAEAGIRFVGPSPDVLEALGDKVRARALAAEAGVPVLAGTAGSVGLDAARAFQRSLAGRGAVMVKAVAGGGGRGMRRVTDPAGLPAAMERCASEAAAAFGDGRIYLEELLVPARHIEIQIVGDGRGAVTALGERDCSIQRRHQKIVELTPSPGLTGEVRDALISAAVAIGSAVSYAGLGTVEFLVSGDRWAFIEVNPRLQVEHTITEEVTGLDLVAVGLQVADGATLEELGLDPRSVPRPRGAAIELRVTLERTEPDGSTVATGGTLEVFDLPSGPGVRVDASGYAGYRVNVRYDPLIAKVIVHQRSGGQAALARRAHRVLEECHIRGTATNLDVLSGIVGHRRFAAGDLDTDFLDDELDEILSAGRAHRYHDVGDPVDGEGATDRRDLEVAPGCEAVRATAPGTVITLAVGEGEAVPAGAPLLVLEAMKMEHEVVGPVAGRVERIEVAPGDTVAPDDILMVIRVDDQGTAQVAEDAAVDPATIRPDLAEVVERHAVGLDERRPAAVAKRHATGLRTARENLADLCDEGSFVEYGALAVAAQRRRRTLEDLIERTPADGMLAGTATINAGLVGEARARAVVLSYDYTVLAGTQGANNHRKKDRIFELAARRSLPVVAYVEGGGGRPGDTDGSWMSMLDVPAFELFAKLSGQVPLVGVAAGRCFAGNAALLGMCDVIIAVEGASIGMGGPAMIEGGGLGVVAPDDVGPLSVQVPNGVVDLVAADEAEATDLARRYLSYFQGPVTDWETPDGRRLRHVVPENRVRVYDVRAVLEGLADVGSALELRPEFGIGMVTALIRVEGRPMGVIANNPAHLGGAIDRDAADKAARFLQLCDAFGLPVVSLCDTPGFMVGTTSEREATVRHFSRLFVTGANLTVPLGVVVTRKCYGLGAQGMCGGSLKAPTFAVSWPTGEFGGMGLEGAVRLGFRKELEAVTDPAERQALFDRLVAGSYDNGKALSVATVFELDDVIDPADTRRWITSSFPLDPAPVVGKRRPFVDTW